jgi:hypothetical protein
LKPPSRALGELTQWTPAATFPPGHALRYERYGLGIGTNTVEGVELLGHTGFIGAFAFHAPGYDAVLAGTHNASQVDRWPLVSALCRELRQEPDEDVNEERRPLSRPHSTLPRPRHQHGADRPADEVLHLIQLVIAL